MAAMRLLKVYLIFTNTLSVLNTTKVFAGSHHELDMQKQKKSKQGVDYEKTMRGAGFMIRCHRCGKLKEPSQFRKLKPVWCTWCIDCENTPIGVIAK